jgi:hypothetical protein
MLENLLLPLFPPPHRISDDLIVVEEKIFKRERERNGVKEENE